MRFKGKIPFKEKLKMAIVVDGQTEYCYLKMLQRNEKNLKIDIKPEIPNIKKLHDQYKYVKELSRIYDKVIWIVDLDVILKENKLNKFITFYNKLNVDFKNVITIINQPCLEYWILIHFNFQSPHFTNCSEAEKLVKLHLLDYSKTQKYFTKQDHDIYLKIRKDLPTAIKNSKKLGEFNPENPHKGFSDMHKIFKELMIEKKYL